MESLKESLSQISSLWKTVYNACEANPALYEPHLRGITHNDVDSAVTVVTEWLVLIEDRKRPSQTYKLAEHMVRTNLPSTIDSLTHLSSGEYNYFNQFVVSINQLLSALFPLTYLGKKPNKERVIAELGGAFAEHLGEMKNLSNVLHKSIEDAKLVAPLVESARVKSEEIKMLTESSTELKDGISQSKVSALQIVTEMNELKRIGGESEKSLSDLAKKSEEIIKELDEQQERMEGLINWSESTEKQIEDLLPGATSTALASASSTRANKMAKNKSYWLLGFIGSAISLGVMIIFFFSVDVSGTTNELYIYISIFLNV